MSMAQAAAGGPATRDPSNAELEGERGQPEKSSSPRVHIFGPPGAGKTTLAAVLALRLKVPHFELDAIASEMGWDSDFNPILPRDERIHALETIVRNHDGWIIEGSSTDWADAALDAADTIVWLDPPERAALARVVSRHVCESAERVRSAGSARKTISALRHQRLRDFKKFVGYTHNYFRSGSVKVPFTRAASITHVARYAPKILQFRRSLSQLDVEHIVEAVQFKHSRGREIIGNSTSEYAILHQSDDIPEFYDHSMYGPGTYDAFIWRVQQKFILDAVRPLLTKASRYLDFACGTGRIMKEIAPYVGETTGLDTSQTMINQARSTLPTANFECTDLLSDGRAQQARYDLITAFRFFLNTEPEIRAPVLMTLAAMLADADARLVFNIHGHGRSALGLSEAYRRLRRWPPVHLMSKREALQLISDAGLEVEACRGFGLTIARLYRSRLRGIAQTLDAAGAKAGWTGFFAQDLVFVCRQAPIKSTRWAAM